MGKLKNKLADARVRTHKEAALLSAGDVHDLVK
jgi:hypothetical protein